MSASDLGPGQVRLSSGGHGRGNFGDRPHTPSSGGGNFPKGILVVIAVVGLFYLNDACPSSQSTTPEKSASSTVTPPPTPSQSDPVSPPASPSRDDSGKSEARGIDFEQWARSPRAGRFFPILSTCSEAWTIPGCLAAAPVKPSKVAAFSFQRSDSFHRSDHVDSDIALVVSAQHLVVNIVPSYDDLPADVKQSGIELHSGADFASIRRSVQSVATAPDPPLIFHGDVRIDVGPLVQEDKMLSMLLLQNSDIKSFEMFYDASAPRGPPSTPVQVVYVIGTVESYAGPDELQKSVHTAGVFDIDLSPSHEQQAACEVDLKTWRSDIARKAGISADLLEGVVDDNAALTIAEAHRERMLFPHQLPEPDSRPVDLFRPRSHKYPTELNPGPIDTFERGEWRNPRPEVYRRPVEPRPRMMFK